MVKLSILKNAKEGDTTYYVGDNVNDISHLKNCTLYVKRFFDGIPTVYQIIVDDPQLEFYKLSNSIPNQYKFNGLGQYAFMLNCYIHPSAVIGDDVIIGNNVTIGPNTVIYSKTEIGDGTRIESNCSIGSEGMMWVWDGDKKVFLRQLGGVKIGKNCVVGSNCSIVRGSANEYTIIEDGVNMSPGCNIGHGTFIGENTHLANGVLTGGSSYISKNVFFGSGSIINPGIKILSQNVIIGSGSVITRNINEDGVFAGAPANKIKNIDRFNKLKGVPLWDKN